VIAHKNNSNQKHDLGTQNSQRFHGLEARATDIPKFDLAEEIMAEQRKISATRRKRAKPPTLQEPKKAESVSRGPKVEPISHTIEQPSVLLLEQEEIIAQIVARDIKRLLQGEGRNGS